jgi:probable phosphoglycerate mutase
MKIHLVRHAQSIWHSENRYAGLADIPLTKIGMEQIESLCSRVINLKITHLFTSDLQRAQLTAAPIARKLKLDLILEPRFREINFGTVEGLTPSEFQSAFPKVYEEFQLNPAHTLLPNGESGAQGLNRARKALYEIFKSVENNSEVLIVAHGTLIRLILCDLIGINIDLYRSAFPKIDNVSVTTLVIREGRNGIFHGGLVQYNHLSKQH